MTISFLKMHGLGNDFVVIDATAQKLSLSETQLRQIADRRTGVGYDQLLLLEPATNKAANVFMRIYNPDGSEAGGCGNGTRCVADLWMSRQGTAACVVQTIAGLLQCKRAGEKLVSVDMGRPRLEWQEIPLAMAQDTAALKIDGLSGLLSPPVAVNMGNPHAVFFVEDVGALDIAALGPGIERHALFPQRTNVEFAQVLTCGKIRMRVWERATGITQACGTGACATLVAAARRGLTQRKAEIILDGGSLFIEWRAADEHVLMTGPVAYVYEGRLTF